MEKRRNQTIDLLKFIFSICIIMIHTQLFKSNDIAYKTITMGIARLAVPFFFITSGYYFYQRIHTYQNIKSYFIKIIKIFIVFEIIEILLYTIPLLSMIQEYGFLRYLWRIMSVGLGGVYWYMISLLLSLIILLPFWKKKSIVPFLLIGLVLYLFVFTNDSYGFFFENTIIQNFSKVHTMIWTWPQAGLCSSLFYLSIGAWIYEKRPIIHHLTIKLCLSIICLMCEAYFLQTHGAYDGNCYVMLIICTPLLFIWALQHETLTIPTTELGTMSLYIYMIHYIVFNCIYFLCPLSQLWIFLITTIVTLCLSYIIVKIQRRRVQHEKANL